MWAYGVTTYKPREGDANGIGRTAAPYRRLSTLPQTLASLARGGFPNPTLFVDGDRDFASWEDEFRAPVVCRYPRIGAFGNWVLALGELMVRSPRADYYAIFQDDMVTSLNLRQYLEAIVYPKNGYLNLFTFPKNQMLSFGRVGFYPADQRGKGAVALVFDREAAVAVISEPNFAKRPRDKLRGHKFIDGGVVDAMKKQGFTEYCHNPSLVQHLGLRSTLSNPRHPRAGSFRGEDYNLLDLLEPENQTVGRDETRTARETERGVKGVAPGEAKDRNPRDGATTPAGRT